MGVYLLLAFTCLGHGCRDVFGPCGGIHAWSDLTPVYILTRRSRGSGFRTIVISRGVGGGGGKKSSDPDGTEKGRTRGVASLRIASPAHHRLGCSGPLFYERLQVPLAPQHG